MRKIESVQYRAALITTGAWNKTSKKKLYGELGLESLSQRRWQKRMTLFCKIINNQTPAYLKDCLHFFHRQPMYFIPRTLNYEASFFPSCVDSWNNDDIITPIMRTYDTSTLKETILAKVVPKRNEIYDIMDKKGLRYLTQLRLDLNPLNYYKFKHEFLDLHDPMCNSNCGIKDAEYFLLNCHECKHIRNTLMSNVSRKIKDFHSFKPKLILKTLLYGNKKYTKDINTYILNKTINYINRSKRFEKKTDDDQAI